MSIDNNHRVRNDNDVVVTPVPTLGRYIGRALGYASAAAVLHATRVSVTLVAATVVGATPALVIGTVAGSALGCQVVPQLAEAAGEVVALVASAAYRRFGPSTQTGAAIVNAPAIVDAPKDSNNK